MQHLNPCCLRDQKGLSLCCKSKKFCTWEMQICVDDFCSSVVRYIGSTFMNFTKYCAFHVRYMVKHGLQNISLPKCDILWITPYRISHLGSMIFWGRPRASNFLILKPWLKLKSLSFSSRGRKWETNSMVMSIINFYFGLWSFTNVQSMVL